MIMQSMMGKNALEFSIKKKDQAIMLGSKTKIKIGKEEIIVDPALLFQRLITAGERLNDLPELFRYELCGYPAALFENNNILNRANKPV